MLQPERLNCSGAKNLKLLRAKTGRPENSTRYQKNAREMREIEKCIIDQSDYEELEKMKEQCSENVCSRYQKNMTQSNLNIKRLEESRRMSKLSAGISHNQSMGATFRVGLIDDTSSQGSREGTSFYKAAP